MERSLFVAGRQPHAPTDAAGSAAALVERLEAVIEAIGRGRVGTEGDELWFDVPSAHVQIRLGERGRARCFDRSANFAISYTRDPSDAAAAPADVRALVDRIKAIDATPIEGAAALFRAAAETAGAAHGVARTVARPEAPETPAPPEPPRAGALDVVFLDFCANLFRSPGEPLAPLHWGYWPDGQGPYSEPAGYDPQRAFSDELLSHVPADVGRVLDVGCGLGFNARLLAARNVQVTAVSPVRHHCEQIERVALPGVEVHCGRFEEMATERQYDLLLFSESLNHFSLDDAFLFRCRSFLARPGYVLMADDLTEERARRIETQEVFRLLRAVNITENVAPTADWWARQARVVAAYHAALLSAIELSDARTAGDLRHVLATIDNPELQRLLSGELRPPASKGRYMIYLLEPADAAAS